MSANARLKDLGKASNRSAKYCSITIRILGGSSRLASMRLVVLVLNRPSSVFLLYDSPGRGSVDAERFRLFIQRGVSGRDQSVCYMLNWGYSAYTR